MHVYDDYLTSAPLVKVLLLKNVKEFRLSIESPFEIYSLDIDKNNTLKDSLYKQDNVNQTDGGGRNLILKSGRLHESIVKVSNEGIIIGSNVLSKEPVEIRPEIDGKITVNGIGYWGNILIFPKPDNTLLVIEETDVDHYLTGVVGKEMPASWTKNTLFAQAVTARTYVLYQKKKRKLDSYHLSKVDLAYKGRSDENDKIIDIVNKSNGIIMVYDWMLFPGYFHSTCGGHTEDVNHVFNEKSIPPLSGVPCGHCEASKYYRWQTDIAKSNIEKNLVKYNVKSDNHLVVKPIGLGKGGHATKIKIGATSGNKTINANTFRLLIGPNKLYSTAFSAKNSNESINFTGRGWGHGVGLCQYGAQGMGASGSKWYEILRHYYPENDLVKIY